jgi:hypothetical protein
LIECVVNLRLGWFAEEGVIEFEEEREFYDGCFGDFQ